MIRAKLIDFMFGQGYQIESIGEKSKQPLTISVFNNGIITFHCGKDKDPFLECDVEEVIKTRKLKQRS